MATRIIITSNGMKISNLKKKIDIRLPGYFRIMNSSSPKQALVKLQRGDLKNSSDFFIYGVKFFTCKEKEFLL